jgi:hypothetical protein
MSMKALRRYVLENDHYEDKDGDTRKINSDLEEIVQVTLTGLN